MNNYFGGEERQFFMGIPVPGKYSCWAELIAIQMATPNASFVGHLSGIIVGLIYMETGILRKIVSTIEMFLSGLLPRFEESGTYREDAGSNFSRGNNRNNFSSDSHSTNNTYGFRDYGSERSYGWRHDIYS